MSTFIFLLILIAGNAYLSFNRMSLKSFAITNAAILVAFLISGCDSTLLGLVMFVITGIAVFLNFVPLRQRFLSQPAFGIFKKVLPSMSTTDDLVGW